MQQDYSVYFVFKIKFDFGEILLRVELQKQMNFEPEMFKKKNPKNETIKVIKRWVGMKRIHKTKFSTINFLF